MTKEAAAADPGRFCRLSGRRMLFTGTHIPFVYHGGADRVTKRFCFAPASERREQEVP